MRKMMGSEIKCVYVCIGVLGVIGILLAGGTLVSLATNVWGSPPSALSSEMENEERHETIIFYEDWESSPMEGWTFDGLWHLTPYDSQSPSHALVYNVESTHTYDTGARNNGSATSPTISIPERIGKCRISFQTRWEHEYYDEDPSGTYDTMEIQIITETWAETLSHWDCNEGAEITNWHTETFDLTEYRAQHIRIRVWFDTVDEIYNNFEGWYIDDITLITEEPAEGLQEDFGDGVPGGWEFTGLWHVSEFDYYGSPYAMAYNDESTHTYDTGSANCGSATSPLFYIPKIVGEVKLSFWTRWEHEYYDDPSDDDYDIMKIQIINATSVDTLKYRDCNEGASITDWHEEIYDLAKYRGQTIQVRFWFDTVDRLNNNFEGWYIDNIIVDVEDLTDIVDIVLSNDTVLIIDDHPNTIAKLLPIMKDGGINPLIIYEPNMEKEISYFISQFKQLPKSILCLHSEATSKYVLSKIQTQDGFVNVGDNAAPFMIDWDNDGRKDIVVGNKEGYVYIFLNEGNSSDLLFSSGFKLRLSDDTPVKVQGFASPVVVDWNNDNKKDLIIGDEEGLIHLFSQDQDEKFIYKGCFKDEKGDLIDVGDWATPTVADWDEDGLKDLIIGEESGYVNLYLNINSSLTLKIRRFNCHNHLDNTYGIASVPSVVDWNNDGNKDLILASTDGISGMLILELYLNADHLYPEDSWIDIVCETLVFEDLYFESCEEIGYYVKLSQSRAHSRVTDCDTDGDMDLVIGGYDGNLYFYQHKLVSIPDSLVAHLQNRFPTITIKKCSIDSLHKTYWLANQTPQELVVVNGMTDNDVTDLTPYGIQYAALQHLPIVNTIEDVSWYIEVVPTIEHILYFGNNVTFFNYLSSLGHISVDKVDKCDFAGHLLLKIGHILNQTVTVIPSISLDPYGYWKPGIIYAVSRNTMLLTAYGANLTEIDSNIEALLAQIKKYNRNGYPDWMTIFASPEIIPIKTPSRKWDDNFDSADETLYADVDGDYLPDLAVGRITHGMNNLLIVSLFAARGIFFNELVQSRNAVFQRGESAYLIREVDKKEPIERSLLYQMGYNVSEYYVPTREQYHLEAIANSEIILTEGHGNWRLVGTDLHPPPHLTSRSIYAIELGKHEVLLSPSFWSMHSCGTSSITKDHQSFLSVLTRQGVVNWWSAVDTAGSTGENILVEQLAMNATIGEACRYAIRKISASPMFTLYGDPLVKYSGTYMNHPDSIPPVIDTDSLIVEKIEDRLKIQINITDNIAVKHAAVWYRQDDAQTEWYRAKEGKLDDKEFYVTPMTKKECTYFIELSLFDQYTVNFSMGIPLQFLIKAYDVNNTARTSLYEIKYDTMEIQCVEILEHWDCHDEANKTDWHEEVYNLTKYRGQHIRIRFWFNTVDDQYNNFEGWYIDNITVTNNESAEEFEVIFNDGEPTGWVFTGLWHVTDFDSYSFPDAIAYNDESTHTYDTGNANCGSATSPLFYISPAADKVTFSFWSRWEHEYYDEDPSELYDLMEVQVLTAFER
ncbi:MAG: VCBS repeat-containing protein [Candidatus Thermoplasmatota archaeon]